MSWPIGTSSSSILLPENMETSVQTQPPEMIETQPHERHDNPRQIRQQAADNTRVGLELGESSVVKRRKRSAVWENFEPYEDEDGKDWARCKLCKKVFDGSSKLGTTHLKNHFKSCQRKRSRGQGGDEPAQLAGNLSNSIPIEENSVMDQQLNHLEVARRIIKQGNASLINSTNEDYIIDVYMEEKEKLRNYFKKLSCRFCVTFYTDVIDGDDCCLMVWFIDEDWKLKNKIIGLRPRNGIKNELSEWGIKNKLSVLVVDDYYGPPDVEGWFHNQRDQFSGVRSLLDNDLLRCEALLRHSDGRDYCLFPDDIKAFVCDMLIKIFDSIEETYEKNEDSGNEINASIKCLDTKMTAEAINFPEIMQRARSDLPDFDLFKDGWKLLGPLEIVLGLKKTPFGLRNIDPEFSKLTVEKWNLLTAAYQVCDGLSDVNNNIRLQYCGNCYTANTHFPTLCRMYKCFKEWRKCVISSSYDMESDVMESAGRVWHAYNSVIAVASVLDPRFRMDIVKNCYMSIFGDEWETEFTKFEKYFINIYNEYAGHSNNFKSCSSASEETNSSISYKMLDPLRESGESSREPNYFQMVNSELYLYLKEIKFPPFKDFDILEWWRFHARYFPTLARMARDFLSIQISCCSPHVSEKEMESIVRLNIEEYYICTKSWLC